MKWEIEGTTIARLYNANFKGLHIVLPPLPEQHRIATALSDVDALIVSLDKLIAKKQAIKQGAMQQLLTGKKRLKGFNEPWVEKRLGEIGYFIGGGTPSTKIKDFWNGNIPWLSSSDIESELIYTYDTSRYITKDAIRYSATQLCPKGTILIITRVGVGKVAIANTEVCTSQDFSNLVLYEDCNKFVAFLLSRVMKQKPVKLKEHL